MAVTLVLVMYGTLWPTSTLADWLSSVMTCGRLRMSMRPCVFKARTSRLKVSLWAEKTKPPMPLVGDTRPTPRLVRPCVPTIAGGHDHVVAQRQGRLVEVEAGLTRRVDRAVDRDARRHQAARGVGVADAAAGADEGAEREDAAVEQHRTLQTDFHAELLVAGQVHLGDQHLDHDLRRLGVQLVDEPHDLGVHARRGADEQLVGDRLGHDDDLLLQVLEGRQGCRRRGAR